VTLQTFTTNKIAAPVGPFSPAVRAGGLTCLSGQIALDPLTGKLLAGDIQAQAEQVLKNLDAVLAAADRTFADVIRVGVYLTDIADFAAVNEVYKRYFQAPYPARTAIAVAALPLGARVEMDAIAR
jgi:2-iminobutanoate/2-iminopropanoate deaminase